MRVLLALVTVGVLAACSAYKPDPRVGYDPDTRGIGGMGNADSMTPQQRQALIGAVLGPHGPAKVCDSDTSAGATPGPWDAGCK